MTGIIIKGIAGFYYVYVAGSGIYECKAKGVFRKDKSKPIVGDMVEISVISDEDMTGNVDVILPRKNSLIRPAVANVDGALVIFAVREPDLHLHLLDSFLVMMEHNNIPAIVCFNKEDLGESEEMKNLRETYEKAGYEVMFTCAKEGVGIPELKERLQGKTWCVAGPSGAGKSTTINALGPIHEVETGELSEKIKRGKQTTRHVELLPIGDDTYIFDTPGFGSMDLPPVAAEELRDLFPEFVEREPNCRFTMCMHDKEPDCAIKEAVEAKEIALTRYENYLDFYHKSRR